MWDDSERLLRLLVARRRKTNAPDHPRLAIDLAALGRNLLEQSKWSEADSTLRESLAIFGRTMPDDWRGYAARSDLGGSLLGQGRFAEAEPLIVGGYEGLQARRSRIPAPAQVSPPGGGRSHCAALRVVGKDRRGRRVEEAAGDVRPARRGVHVPVIGEGPAGRLGRERTTDTPVPAQVVTPAVNPPVYWYIVRPDPPWQMNDPVTMPELSATL